MINNLSPTFASMKDNTTFDAAYLELTQLSQHIQSGEISIDDLSTSVRRATELIQFCKERLRKVEGDISSLFDDIETTD